MCSSLSLTGLQTPDTFGSVDIEGLKSQFAQIHGREVSAAVRAPGRVNLIGEHTDYNDGFVLPIAIEKQIAAGVAPRDDRTVTFASMQMETGARVDLDEGIVPGEPTWTNYCKGVAAGLVRAGVDLCGADVLFDSDIPQGAGLGSSAALEVCTAMALLVVAGKIGVLDDRDLVRLSQKAEHEFAAAPCGIMDQSISLMGRAGHAMLLDCRSGQIEHVAFDDPDKVLIIVNTMVRHEIADGAYAERRAQCESAARKLGVESLRDADDAMIRTAREQGRLTEIESARAYHVVREIARTLEAAEALKHRDYSRFGELMYASHESLRDDFAVSCDQLDAVVDLARNCKGVCGARMTGGGFGGCAIILVSTDQSEMTQDFVAEGFQKRFGSPCDIFTTRAAAGASAIE